MFVVDEESRQLEVGHGLDLRAPRVRSIYTVKCHACTYLLEVEVVLLRRVRSRVDRRGRGQSLLAVGEPVHDAARQ